MSHPINRREFLKTSGSAAAAAPLLGHQLLATRSMNPDADLKISLAQWSLHRTLGAGKMDNLEFAKVAKEKYGIQAIEYVNSFFKDRAKDTAYLNEMKKRAADHGVKSLLIMVDGEGALGDANGKRQNKAIQNHHKWLDAARHLGCHSIRVNAQSSGSWTEQRDRAAHGLHELCLLADQAGLNVIVENHGGLSSNGRWLSETMRKADHPRCGTLPDFGNFRVRGNEWYDRYTGMKDLLPYAKAVSAKSHEFDDKGNEIHTDFKRMINLVRKAGYRGHIGIEYEGSKHSEHDGILLTKALLERVISS